MIQHIALVLEAAGLCAQEKAVLTALCNHTDPSGKTFAGEERLMREAGMPRTTFQRWRSQLVTRKLILSYRKGRKGGGRTTSDTWVNIEALRALRDPFFGEKPGDRPEDENPFTVSKAAPKWDGSDVDDDPKYISMTKRMKVFKRDGYVCRWCGTDEDLTVDHIKHQSRGGTHELDNLQTLCHPCNSRRGVGVIPGVDRVHGEEVAGQGIGSISGANAFGGESNGSTGGAQTRSTDGACAAPPVEPVSISSSQGQPSSSRQAVFQGADPAPRGHREEEAAAPSRTTGTPPSTTEPSEEAVQAAVALPGLVGAEWREVAVGIDRAVALGHDLGAVASHLERRLGPGVKSARAVLLASLRKDFSGVPVVVPVPRRKVRVDVYACPDCEGRVYLDDGRGNLVYGRGGKPMKCAHERLLGCPDCEGSGLDGALRCRHSRVA